MRFLPIILETRSSKKPPIDKLNLSTGGHFEQIQDGRHPDTSCVITLEPSIIETCVIPIFRGFGGRRTHWKYYFCDFFRLSCSNRCIYEKKWHQKGDVPFPTHRSLISIRFYGVFNNNTYEQVL